MTGKVSRGFATLATGKLEYYKMARNLLCSYRFHNPEPLPFAIICDRENEFTAAFDDVVLFDDPSFSLLDKVRLPQLAPYEQTIFIDADSLVLRNLDPLWDIVADSPDFGIFGRVWDPDSEYGRIEYDRGGRFRDKMRFACTCQGGMYFIRKTPALVPFQELSLFILDHYEEFHKSDDPHPSDDNIFPLACSVSGFPPPADWYGLFCFCPESDIRKIDVVKGVVRYHWRVCDMDLGEGCFFVHFSSALTREWMYRREAYRIVQAAEGRIRPFWDLTLRVWLPVKLLKLRRLVPVRVKSFLYRMNNAIFQGGVKR